MAAIVPPKQQNGVGRMLSNCAPGPDKDGKNVNGYMAMMEAGDDPGHPAGHHLYETADLGLLPSAISYKEI